MVKTIKDNMPNYKGVKHDYMKMGDINNFNNYEQMLESKFQSGIEN